MSRLIKQNRFRSYAAEKEAKMDSHDRSCADMSYAVCTKYPKLDENLGQIEFWTFFAGFSWLSLQHSAVSVDDCANRRNLVVS